MDVSSSLTGPKEFRIVKRGYDPDEVDAFLDQISLGVAELKRKLAEAGDRPAEAQPSQSVPLPASAATDQVEEIHRALILAQRAADEEVRKATEEAETIRAEAHSSAEEARVGAEVQAAESQRAVEEEMARRREEGRAGLRREINDLEGIRDSLASDVVVLERHVDEQREVVQAAVGELQSLLDHPEAFRTGMAPGVSTGPTLLPDEPPQAPAAVASDPEADPQPEPDAVVTSEATDDLQVGPPPAPGAEVSDDEAPPASAPEVPDALVFPEDPASTEPPAVEAEATPDVDLSDDDLSDDDLSAAGGDDDAGPPTEATSAVSDSDSEDAFLAELRKAMLDDEPLGPREDSHLNHIASAPEEEPARGRSRFGRRK